MRLPLCHYTQAEHLDDVLFLKVEYDVNKDMCKTMGIKVGLQLMCIPC